MNYKANFILLLLLGCSLVPREVAAGYDPTIGRWVSRDPLPDAELNQGPNPYAYASNRPIRVVDPDGRQAALAFPVIVGAGGIAIGVCYLDPACRQALKDFGRAVCRAVEDQERLRRCRELCNEDWYAKREGMHAATGAVPDKMFARYSTRPRHVPSKLQIIWAKPN